MPANCSIRLPLLLRFSRSNKLTLTSKLSESPQISGLTDRTRDGGNRETLMKNSILKLASAATFGAGLLLAGQASAADTISGKWRTQSGETAVISSCGSAYCIKLASGAYAGKRIGRMSGSGNSYSGTITDPSDDKKYSGSARVSGKTMKMRGCALKIFCKTQTWKKL